MNLAQEFHKIAEENSTPKLRDELIEELKIIAQQGMFEQNFNNCELNELDLKALKEEGFIIEYGESWDEEFYIVKW